MLSNLLGDMLFHGVDPRDPRARGLYSAQSAASSPFRDDRVWTSVTTAGSLFAGLDQCPQALLHHLSHCEVQGVQHHLQLVDSGCDPLSLESSLNQHRTVTVTDWDSADAFLREQREDCTPLNRLLCLPWDFGPWALKYYGRLRIHPLTDDGFAPPPTALKRGGIRGTTPLGTLTRQANCL